MRKFAVKLQELENKRLRSQSVFEKREFEQQQLAPIVPQPMQKIRIQTDENEDLQTEIKARKRTDPLPQVQKKAIINFKFESPLRATRYASDTDVERLQFLSSIASQIRVQKNAASQDFSKMEDG